MAETAIERHQGDALSTILGTGDTRSALAQVEKNVRDIIEVCRERGFITHYRNENKKTGEVRESDFYGLPAWQLLGMTYGVTPIVTTLDAIDGGFKAYAVARTRDGFEVGGDFGLCHRKEPGKQYKSDHDLAAMASARAKRNALRSALGAALVLAGFDFPDPDAPATNEQVGLLHQLERELGLTHEQGHAESGVDSYKDFTREGASLQIERWTALRDQQAGVGDRAGSGSAQEVGGSSPSPGEPERPPVERGGSEAETTLAYGEGAADSPVSESPDPFTDGPASAKQWEVATRHGLVGAKLRRRVKAKGWEVKTASDVTDRQLAELIAEELG